MFLAIPTPPLTMTAPVPELVESTVFDTLIYEVAPVFKLPATFVFSPIYAFPPIPTPPLTTKAPVPELEDSVIEFTDKLPATFAFAPIYAFPPIPTPPFTTNAPVAVLVDTALLAILTLQLELLKVTVFPLTVKFALAVILPAT